MESDNINIDLSNESVLHGVFTKYYHPLCFYARRILRECDTSAKDVVQDVFISVWGRKLVFKTLNSLKAYLYYSVYHSCIDVIKSKNIHQRHHRHILDEYERQSLDKLQFLNDRIEAEVLVEIFMAIEQLPVQCRKVFRLSYMDGMSVEQVASELKVSVNTVKTQRARGKKLLKESLKNIYSILACMFLC